MLDFEFIRYLGGGFASFLVDLVLIKVFLILGWSKDTAIVVGFVLSTMVFSFFFHKLITFQAGSQRQTFRRYLIAATILFILDIGGSILLSDILLAGFGNDTAGLRLFLDRDGVILIAKVLAASSAGLINFFFLKQWVFREREQS